MRTGLRIAALLQVVLLAACGARGDRLRDLPGTGALLVPERLEDRSPESTEEGTVWHFDRIADSFLLMGSHTPVRERLTVLAWPTDGGPAPDLDRRFRAEAAERVGSLRWRREGDLEIGEGVHRVNAHATPAWVVLHRPAGARLALGYMVWRKDADLAEAVRTVRRMAGTFRPPAA